MNFSQYVEFVRGMMQSDLDQGDRFDNWLLGLLGECGEFADATKKKLFHGVQITDDEFLKELGDVLWYVTAIAIDSQVFDSGKPFDESYFSDVSESMIDNDHIALVKEQCRLAVEVVTKFDDFLLGLASDIELRFAIATFCTSLMAIAIQHDFSLQEIINRNYQKLVERHGGTEFNRDRAEYGKVSKGGES